MNNIEHGKWIMNGRKVNIVDRYPENSSAYREACSGRNGRSCFHGGERLTLAQVTAGIGPGLGESEGGWSPKLENGAKRIALRGSEPQTDVCT